NFAELLAPAIELTERGVPVSRGALSSRGFLKYPTSMRIYGPPDGQAWQDGQMWKNPDLARTFRRLVEAEKEAMPQGRQAALKAARDRFYKGVSPAKWPPFPRKAAPCSATKTLPIT